MNRKDIAGGSINSPTLRVVPRRSNEANSL